ncbi:MAG: hypothetical protein JJ863_29130 [Deltaproteobacteria bacterium]|nr:hypothetical protein [Deltaproteobacteria bacterium]
MTARAAACVALLLAACDSCGTQESSPDLGGRSTSTPTLTPEVQASTPAGRAAAHMRALPEEREAASRRATLLADGRRHGRAGGHAQALRSFEDALGDGGPDATLHCEAGYQAIQLGQWALARRHLDAGLSVAVQPRRRAACLYDLALVDEAEQDIDAAIASLRESLSLRPNGTVRRKLDALEAAAEVAESSADDADDAGAVDAEEERSPTLEALCPESECQRDEVEIPARPDGWPELAFISRELPDEPMLATGLVLKDDSGWWEAARVCSSDARDVYGALEASETVTGVRFEEGDLVVSVAGGFDEHEDEAGHYFECEQEHQLDHAAVMACFEAATEGLPPPESWSFDLVFALEGGEVVLKERRAGNASQSPVE